MTTVAIRRDTNLGELELCPARNLRDVVNGDRIVIRPPSCGTPCLHDFFAGLQHQVDSRYVRSPSCEFSSDLAANFCGLARQRLMLLRVHEHVVDLMRRDLERNRLLKRSRSHFRSLPRRTTPHRTNYSRDLRPTKWGSGVELRRSNSERVSCPHWVRKGHPEHKHRCLLY